MISTPISFWCKHEHIFKSILCCRRLYVMGMCLLVQYSIRSWFCFLFLQLHRISGFYTMEHSLCYSMQHTLNIPQIKISKLLYSNQVNKKNFKKKLQISAHKKCDQITYTVSQCVLLYPNPCHSKLMHFLRSLFSFFFFLFFF